MNQVVEDRRFIGIMVIWCDGSDAVIVEGKARVGIDVESDKGKSVDKIRITLDGKSNREP